MDNYENAATEILDLFNIVHTPRDVVKVANIIQQVADEARRELINKLISVGEDCNGMVSVPVLKAWRLEFEDIDLDGWKNLEGLGGEGDE